MSEIPQSAVIFGALVLMFLAFITVKGELRTYMGFIF